jgi:alanyl-tRNA synthetase
VTERIYLADSYVRRFDARVTAVRALEGRPAVVLDRTAFYPDGGGQPSDRGTVGGVPVADVREVDGEVLHVLDGPAPTGEVSCEVDWRRRFDHMQQHHGQHLLSAAFERLLGARTVSFHLGTETCTLDLDAPPARIGPEGLGRAEAAANELVVRDLEVEARERTPEELAALPLRKEAVKGTRIVVVRAGRPGAAGGAGVEAASGPAHPADVVEASPCGGTHPRRTGEVGSVAVLGAQKWGAGTRVEFVCGSRVLAALHAAEDRLARAAAAFRCAPAEVPAAAAKAAEEATARRKELEGLLGALGAAHAERLLAGAAAGPVVARLEPPLCGPVGLRAVAQALASRGRTALLGGVDGGRAHLCFARPRGQGPNLGEVLRRSATVLGGKGGGSPELAQGSGPETGALGRALDSAREWVEDRSA